MTVLETEPRTRTAKRTPRVAAATAVGLVAAISVIVFTAFTLGEPVGLPSGALFTTSEDGSLSLVDTETGEWIYEVPDAALAPDRSTIYQATHDGEETVLTSLDPATVEELSAQRLPGKLQIRVVSAEGDAVALMAPRMRPGLYVPEPRENTNVFVARTDGSTWRRYSLEGNYEPEAFSVDGRTLFMLKFLPADDPDHYEVHRLDLETGAIINDYTPEVGLETWMKGHARSQVMAPDGRFLYTLYTLDQGEDPIHDPALTDSPDYHAFVHVISLEEEWSYCIFLPMPFGQGPVDSVGLAISPDGSSLAVVDKRSSAIVSGVLFDIDTADLAIVRRNVIGAYPDASGPVPIAIAPDQTIYMGSGSLVAAFDAANRNFVSSFEAAGTVRSINLSDDGRRLMVAVTDRIHVIELSSGLEIGNLVLPDEANQVIVGPATKSKFETFTCAC